MSKLLKICLASLQEQLELWSVEDMRFAVLAARKTIALKELLSYVKSAKERAADIVQSLQGNGNPQSKEVYIKAKVIKEFCEDLERAANGDKASIRIWCE